MSFNPHVSTRELEALSDECGLEIQHECGGYRVVKTNGSAREDVFPHSGICPTVARLACYIFLCGVQYGMSNNNSRKEADRDNSRTS